MWIDSDQSQGYMPTNPRRAPGSCAAFARQYNQPAPDVQNFAGPLSAWQTGGAGAGNIVAAQTNSYKWPPNSIGGGGGGNPAQLPQYTPTGTPITMTPGPAPTNMPAGVAMPNGWANPSDVSSWYGKRASRLL